MFLLKSLSSVIFGQNQNSLVQLPSGKFYTASNTVVFPKATATVMKTSKEFAYQLVVTALESEDLDDSKEFLIDKVLCFKLEGDAFIWTVPIDPLNS